MGRKRVRRGRAVAGAAAALGCLAWLLAGSPGAPASAQAPDDCCNLIDDDRDGFIDLADPDCASHPECRPLPCVRGDFNGDGQLNVTDVIPILAWLFQQGPLLPPPFPGCGMEATPDPLPCLQLGACQGQ